jgi:uncharacterized protein YkwD
MSCHWTTPQWPLTSSHAAPPMRANSLAARLQDSSHPRILQPCRTLLSGTATTARRLLATATSVALALLVSLSAPLLAAARAVATRRAAPPCPGADLLPDPANLAAASAATECLLNRVRASRHERGLRANRYLQGVAFGKVRQMVGWDYFADQPPAGNSAARLIAASRYGAHAARLSTGQNIGWGTGADSTPASMVAAWMASPPHRMLILAPGFSDVGVGVSQTLPAVLEQSRRGGLYAVEFGARR